MCGAARDECFIPKTLCFSRRSAAICKILANHPADFRQSTVSRNGITGRVATARFEKHGKGAGLDPRPLAPKCIQCGSGFAGCQFIVQSRQFGHSRVVLAAVHVGVGPQNREVTAD